MSSDSSSSSSEPKAKRPKLKATPTKVPTAREQILKIVADAYSRGEKVVKIIKLDATTKLAKKTIMNAVGKLKKEHILNVPEAGSVGLTKRGVKHMDCKISSPRAKGGEESIAEQKDKIIADLRRELAKLRKKLERRENNEDESSDDDSENSDSEDENNDDDSELSDSEADNQNKEQKYPIGTTIYKMFEDPDTGGMKEYAGKVVEYDASSLLYSIEYEDGDVEDMNEEEVRDHLEQKGNEDDDVEDTIENEDGDVEGINKDEVRDNLEQKGSETTNAPNKGSAFRLTGLPTICLGHCMSYLGNDDLISAALVCKQFRECCQKKIVPTIEIKPKQDFKIGHRKFEEVMTQLRSRQLKIGEEKALRYRRMLIKDGGQFSFERSQTISCQLSLQGVLELEYVLTPGISYDRVLPFDLFVYLPPALPNLREVSLSTSNLTMQNNLVFDSLCTRCPALEKITFHNSSGVKFNGFGLLQAKNLKEIHMDNHTFSIVGCPSLRIFDFCIKKLERVSIRNAKYFDVRTQRTLPVPQEKLIQFVLHCPNLRWFRSDLSPENINLLRSEPRKRPWVDGPSFLQQVLKDQVQRREGESDRELDARRTATEALKASARMVSDDEMIQQKVRRREGETDEELKTRRTALEALKVFAARTTNYREGEEKSMDIEFLN